MAGSVGSFFTRAEILADDGPDPYGGDTPLKSYVLHQGRKFIKRFDANS